jgi:hypothetical protein
MKAVDVKEFVAAELKGLDRGFVATPESLEALQAFAKANQGSMDIILMQMAIQYGAKVALQSVKDLLETVETA